MSTRQEAIILKIVDILTSGLPGYTPAIQPLANLKGVHRSCTRPIEEDELPAFAIQVVENKEDDSEGGFNMPDGPFKRVVWVWIEGRVIGDSSDADGPAEKYLDPMVEFAMTVLLSNPTLDGLATHIEPERVVYDGFQGKEYYLAGAMLFRVYYLGDPI